MADQQTHPDNVELQADDADSALGGSDGESETTTLASIYKGYYENGRKYQNVGLTEYFQPTDEKQWAAMEQGHMLMLILNSQLRNPLFRSELSDKAQNVIDLGTGNGDWALDVADRHPNLTVYGVDLMAPPRSWTAPNCIFEVDDIMKPWTYNKKWDLVHMRHLLGAFSPEDFKKLYQTIYDNVAPGGWIEQTEQDVGIYCDDSTLPADSMLRGLRDIAMGASICSGRPLDTVDHMRERIEAAGFINVHEQQYKIPLGTWPKLQVYKDAGRVAHKQMMAGLEGWVLFLLTHFGDGKSEPWSVAKTQEHIEMIKRELDAGYHIYNKAKRVWAQKPYDTAPEAVNGPAAEVTA